MNIMDAAAGAAVLEADANAWSGLSCCAAAVAAEAETAAFAADCRLPENIAHTG